MSRSVRNGLRALALAGGIAVVVGATAAPAFACAGLVGENGTIRLERTSTLAAYHGGVERYVTSFAFSGEGKEVGSIVPLPGVPSDVTRAGDWTLQRLEREVAPPQRFALKQVAASAADGVEVLQQKKIDALDITILRGGGTEVGKWATDHGFLLTPDAPEMLDFYSRRSPVFMAARFDVARARALGQNSGDGTPIMLTIPTKAPWVPLRILGLGLDKSAPVNADVFLLTDDEPKLLAGGPGLELERHDWASPELLRDLRSDKHMEWVPNRMWLTYMPLSTTAGRLDYDLAISDHPGAVPDLAATGVQASQVRVLINADHSSAWPAVLGVLAGIATFVLVGVFARRRSHVRAAA
jgi:Uncharacterized protein conserved in bacteria (DUF2330)